MSIAQSMLPEFDHEMTMTRKILERVPANGDWKPHEKSMTLGRLAMHVATLPGWATMTVERSVLDLADKSDPAMAPNPFTTPERLLSEFDRLSKNARASLAGVSDEELMKTWTLKMGDHEILAMPKVAVLRGIVMNHLIHHRGQLSVYLRLNGVPVPGMYGPSADEM